MAIRKPYYEHLDRTQRRTRENFYGFGSEEQLRGYLSFVWKEFADEVFIHLMGPDSDDEGDNSDGRWA